MQTTSASPMNPSDTADSVKNLGSKTNTQPAAVVSRLGALAHETLDTVQKVVDDGKQAAKEQYEATSRWVGDATKENPMRALGIVATAGFVLGLLIGRR